jgi:hypothetical protein
MIKAGGLLGENERFAQRQDRTGGPNSDLAGLGGEPTGIDHGIPELADVTEVGVVEWYVTSPKRSDTKLIGTPDQRRLIVKRGDWLVRITFERRQQAEGQPSGPEKPTKGWMVPHHWVHTDLLGGDDTRQDDDLPLALEL